MKKLLSATDEDITKAIDTLVAHPNCTGPYSLSPRATRQVQPSDAQTFVVQLNRTDWRHRNVLRRALGVQGSSSLSLSEILHFSHTSLTRVSNLPQTALDPRCKAAVCYFATDIHSASLSPTGDDSLERASKGEIRGEVVMIFGTQDGHVVSPPLSSLGQESRVCRANSQVNTDLYRRDAGIDSRSRAGIRSGTH